MAMLEMKCHLGEMMMSRSWRSEWCVRGEAVVHLKFWIPEI